MPCGEKCAISGSAITLDDSDTQETSVLGLLDGLRHGTIAIASDPETHALLTVANIQIEIVNGT